MSIEVKVPGVGESINEVEIGEWRKRQGERVAKDEVLVLLESEKATLEFPCPVSGTLSHILKRTGETAAIGEVIARIEPSEQPQGVKGETKESGKVVKGEVEAVGGRERGGAAEVGVRPPAPEVAARGLEKRGDEERRVMPAARRVLAERGLEAARVRASGPGGRLLKEDVLRHAEAPSVEGVAGAGPGVGEARKVVAEAAGGVEAEAAAEEPSARAGGAGREEEVVRMSRLRRTLAERLVQAQQTAALLTTFNEIDMAEVIGLRKRHGEAFQQKHGVKLGFMSFFVKASVEALKIFPAINAEIRGQDIVFHNYYDIGVAIGGGKGLVVPVLRNAERLSFAEIELAIADFAKRAKENRLTLEELRGGTFTISNGGVYGSLLSTPIINPPQSGILGLHVIEERPVAREGQVLIRPMMYVALTYDHRIVDGREAVTFLKRIKETIEEPARMLFEA